ncbi:GNAT family N-acetyltransferase [Lapillicoccus sp.]|uniref:GNAT family N-acetyltransferase n=1 Tax=Lapillicoccus sp. TaxID=1909287 RepID=UPI0025CF9EB2|nr:GNAT family N-acetyltransferase [Lapillicoccus sp.]
MTDRAGEVELHVVSPDEWETHRALRLEMLLDSPDAFWTTHAEAAAMDEAQWRERIVGTFHVMATLDGEPVGSVGLWPGREPDPDETNLIAMYVAPRARGQRVGERLVTAVQDAAVREGRRRIHLEVTSSNAPAIRLYERMGFVFTGASSPHPRRAELEERAMVWTALGYRSGDGRAKVAP